jgi:hypothetical protein
MGWMAVHVPVKAFENTTGIQVWYLGSGLDFDKFNSGAGTKGAGIVILNGNTTGSFLEYILDLDDVRNPNPVNAAGVWEFSGNVFTLLGDAGATVRVIGDTVARRIQVKDGADVSVVLDGMSIITPAGGSPFALGNGSKATLHLADGTINNLTGSNTYAGLQANDGIAGLFIEGNDGELRATGGYRGAGIGGSSAAGGAITINGGRIIATGDSGGAGIGGGNNGTTHMGYAGGSIRINGGVVTATATVDSPTRRFSGAGIGGGGGELNAGNGGNIRINGGTVYAQGDKAAGIGGGSSMDYGGDGGDITILGGIVIAKGGVATSSGSAGIGGGSTSGVNPGGDGGNIQIANAVVIAEGGDGPYGGAGIGGARLGNGGTITLSGGTIYAKGYGTAESIGMGSGGTSGTVTTSNTPVIFASSPCSSGVNTSDPGIFVSSTYNVISALTIDSSALTFTSTVRLMFDNIPEIPVGAIFTVPSGMIFEYLNTYSSAFGPRIHNYGAIVNHGTINYKGGFNYGTLTNYGTINLNGGNISINPIINYGAVNP